MKELYLIPKHIYEIMQSGSNHGNDKPKNNRTPQKGEHWRTTLLPPPLQNKIHLNEVKIPDLYKSNNNKQHHKSSLQDQLNLRFKPENLPHAKLILKYFERSPDTQWDDYGDLFTPINGYNIIDIIHDFIFKIDIKDPLKINNYRFLVSTTNMPLHYIRNNPLKKSLSNDNQFHNLNIKTPQKVGAGGRKPYHIQPTWSVY